MSIEEFIAEETQLILQIAQDAVKKILAGENINHEEKMSILEIWMSHFHLNNLQAIYGSKTLTM